MIVGLNLLFLLPGTVGGTETYAAGLIRGLAESRRDERFLVFVNRESERWPLPAHPAFERIVCPVQASDRMARYRWEQLSLPRLLAGRHRVDLLHSLGYVAPLRLPCPSVVTIHDLNYRAFGNRMPAARRLMLRLFVEGSARRAARVITVSDFSRSEILSAVRIAPERIRVTHEAPRERPAVDPEQAALLRGRLNLPERYLLAFSSSTPNKNIPRLLEAFARARREHALPHELVLVGHPPSLAPPRPSHAPDGGGIHFTGYVDDDSLAAVLDGAEALVFPSTYEGFGLPVLEAMAAGVPVACSHAASLPEVAGDAALYFDPSSSEQMAAAIGRIALDAELRVTLRARGADRVRRFSWTRMAEQTIAVYDEVLGLRGGAVPRPALPPEPLGEPASVDRPGTSRGAPTQQLH